MKKQYIDNILCVGEINDNTSHIEFYTWDLGAHKQDHPKNFLRLDGRFDLSDEVVSFEDLIEERHKRWIDGLGMGGYAKQFSKLVAVQKDEKIIIYVVYFLEVISRYIFFICVLAVFLNNAGKNA